MKQNYYGIATLLLVVISLTFIINGCNKLNPDKAKQYKGDQNATLEEQSNAVTAHILAFKKKMEYNRDNPETSYKSDNEITADSALRLIEATLNYSYTFPWYDKYKIETIESIYDTIFSTTDDLINDQRVNELYNEIEAQVRQDYIGSQFSEKKLLTVDLSFFENEQHTLQIKSVIIITCMQPPSPEVGPPPPYDDWKYGYGMGYCNDSMPPSSDDAGIILTNDINESFGIVNSSNKWYAYNSNTITFPYSDYPNPQSLEKDNYLDYFIFYAQNYGGLTVGDDEICLSGYEMVWYKNHTINIFNDYLTAHSGINFQECWIVGHKETSGYPNYSLLSIQHLTSAAFGYSIARENGDSPVDID